MRKRWRLYLLLISVAGLGLLYVSAVPVARKGSLPTVQRIECTVADRGLVPASASPFPPVSEDDWTWGPEDATVTLIEYADFQCPHCGAVSLALAQLRTEYPEDLRLVYRHFPLESLYDKAKLAAQAAEAAGAQGQFWPMHDLLFARQGDWEALSADEFQDWLIAQAGELGLDAERFAPDLVSPENVAAVEQAYDEAIDVGLDGAPTLVINGHYYEGIKDKWTLAAFIELIKLEQRHFHECPPIEINTRKHYTATLHTTKGDIAVELLPRQAPLAVNNFVFLVRQGWYDGVPFHRVMPGFVTQTGDPSGTGLGGPGYTFKDEIAPDALFDEPGVVGMANAGPDTNGSQFFITYAAQESFNGKYTIFGNVVAGMDVTTKLTKRDPATDPTALPPADRILSVTIEEK